MVSEVLNRICDKFHNVVGHVCGRSSESVAVFCQIYHKDPRNSTRLALLITNIEFEDDQMQRHGAETDEDNMQFLLRGLGYQVVKLRNLSGKVLWS